MDFGPGLLPTIRIPFSDHVSSSLFVSPNVMNRNALGAQALRSVRRLDRADRYDPFVPLSSSAGDGRFVLPSSRWRSAQCILADGDDPIALPAGSTEALVRVLW